MREQLLLSVLSDLNSTSTDISASAVISTDGLPIATLLPNHLNADRVGAMSATLLALGNTLRFCTVTVLASSVLGLLHGLAAHRWRWRG